MQKHTIHDQGFLPVADGNLWYERTGQGPDLVLIHAGIADSRMWDDQADSLARSHTVLRYDLRDFGRSSVPTSSFSHTDDLHTLLNTLGIERTALTGSSFGGLIAIDFALKHPEMVEALVLLAPAISGYRWSDETRAWWPRIDEALERGALEAAVELETQMWVDGPHRRPDQVDPLVRERAKAMNLDLYRKGSDESLVQEAERAAVGRLGELRVPALVIVGEGDRFDMQDMADLIRREAPNARKVVLPDAAHLVSMEQPDEVTRLIAEFLDEPIQ